MRKIYTTEKIRIEGVEVLGNDKLSEKTRMWVEKNRRQLMRNATLPESITAKMLSTFGDRPARQAFFMIRKRCYFLDFFFSEMMLAVEIDGSSHRGRKEHDRRRDADFRSIGIKTIRISNKDVMCGKLYEKISKRLYK